MLLTKSIRILQTTARPRYFSALSDAVSTLKDEHFISIDRLR